MTSNDSINILLVDDQPAKLLSYESILDGLGANLIKAGSAREALEHLLKTDVAVVLVDVCMPELDGFELASMIREHPRFQKTAIIFISAVHLTDLDRLRGYECGAVDYVPVPVIPEILRAKVGVFADLYRKTQQLERLNRELEQRVAERTADLEASTTRLRQSEEALREADRRKDEFLATLAHELRNPLAPMRNAIKVLGLKESPDPELKWSREVIDRQLDHLTRLIDDLLDVSRITRNQLELRREPVELAAIVRGAVESTRPLIDERDHKVILTLPPDPVCVSADVIRLTQVMINLLNNAARYTPHGGCVWLSVELVSLASSTVLSGKEAGDGREVVIRVKDTGVGIVPEHLPHIFEAFYQADRSLERSQGGLGIGLTLVRRLVELHGGIVEVHSAGINQGSEFIVRLPVLAESAMSALTQEPSRHREQPATARRVLVVDDNHDSAESLALLLQLTGYEVKMAHDGLEAVEAAAKLLPQVVLLDIGMPNLNGYDAARQIRQQAWGKDMVLIALTGWGQEQDRERTREAGFDAHLLKPVDHDALIKLLASTPGRTWQTGG
jgi:signal transduction histidine kinase